MQSSHQERSVNLLARRLRSKVIDAAGDLAYRDDLTGLFNYRLLSAFLGQWWTELIGPDDQLSLIIIDLDGFKDVNDRYGHLTGDTVLKTIAKILRDHFRSDDLLIRYGGDEFVIVLPGAPAAEAGEICERARTTLTRHTFTTRGDQDEVKVTVSFSMGLASYPDDNMTGQDLLQVADNRLYLEKKKRHSRQDRIAQQKSYLSPQLIVSVFVGLILIGIVFYDVWQQFFAIEPPPAEINRLARSPRPVRDAAWAQREQAFLAQIEELQNQISELSAQKERGSPREQNEQVQRIALLEAEIRTLQGNLAELSQVGAEQADDHPDDAFEGPPEPTETDMADQVIPTHSPAPTMTPTVTLTATVASVETRPVRTSIPPVIYPAIAAKLHKEAEVTLKLLIDVEGRVVQATTVGEKAGYGFDEEAVRVALKARYQPGTRNGVPVMMETMLSLKFTLQDNQ
ncbi:TonB family protein [bacterium]|nr:TonB family protein [bacterium]